MPAMNVNWESLSSSLISKMSLQITSTDEKFACISTAVAYVTFPNHDPWPKASLDIWGGGHTSSLLKSSISEHAPFISCKVIIHKLKSRVTSNHFQWKSPKEMLSSSVWLPELELNCWDHYMLLLLMEGRNMHIITWRTSLLKSSGNGQ